ncbi:MAG: cell division protein ZapA [Legionellaceae bacterium]|nr:cell division protein ZapA [Legionellaceae bacterium]
MSAASSCTITLLNQSYQVRCPAHEEDHLRAAGENLDQLMRKNQQQFSALDHQQLLVLAALECSHALIKQRHKQEQDADEVESFIQTLEARLEQVAKLGHALQSDAG